MLTKLRSAVGIAMIWLAAVAGVSATAWFAIDRAGRDITDAGVSSLSSLPANPAIATTAPRAGPPPANGTSQPSASTSATPRDRSVSVAGGQVLARCTGATILLRIAQPNTGWRVDVDSSGPREVDLGFKRGAEDTRRETQVTAVCANGTPAFTVTSKS